MRRVFRRQGLGFVMELPDIVTELAVDRLSRSRGELHGELLVTSGLPGTRSSDGHLHQARFNLSGTEARKRVAATLAARANTANDLDWVDVLEDFCRRVLAAEREGAPLVRVGTLPRPIGINWRVDPLIPVGKPVILYGEGGSGKSSLAAAIAVSVETGVTIVPGFVPRRAPVLYLDWEADQDELNDRVAAVAMGAHLPHPVDIAYRPCFGPLADQVEDVARLVSEHKAGLVLVDSIGLASGTSSDGGDAAETALRLFSAFRVLQAAQPGCSVLGVDHVSKAEAEAAGRSARPYGSIYKTNLARAMFELRRGPTINGRTSLGLYNTKSNVRSLLGPIGLTVTYEDDGAVTYERLDYLPTELTKPLRLADRIYALLIGGNHLTLEEIAAAVEADKEVVRVTMKRAKNRFGSLSSGVWEAIPNAS